MASISSSMALLIAAGVSAAGAAGTATVSNMNAISARQQAGTQQAANLAAAEAAANKSTGALTTNAGSIDLQSNESLADAEIRSKSKKNRLRVDNTGLSLAGSAGSTGNATGLKL